MPKAVYQTAKQVVTHPIQTAQSIVVVQQEESR